MRNFAGMNLQVVNSSLPVVSVPGSKSISNRLLMLRHTFVPGLRISGLSASDDTRLLQWLLERVDSSQEGDGIVELDVRNCGTAFRFLLPYLAGKRGRWRLTGAEPLRRRPIRPLVELLRGWGAEIRMPEEGSIPIEVTGNPALQPQSAWVDVAQSSQFLSALLLSLPLYGKAVRLRYALDAPSGAYVRMTVGLMRELGLPVTESAGEVCFEPGFHSASPALWRVEGDWSAAAFWWAWAALQPPPFALRVQGVSETSWQGDARICRLLAPWGLHTVFTADGAWVGKTAPLKLPASFRMDARDCLDLVPLLAVLCLLSGIPARFDGVANLRAKESDRVEALRENLSPWADVTLEAGSLCLLPNGNPVREAVSFRSFNDHRVVMALQLFSAFVPVSHDHPKAVSKSYPAFWEQFAMIRP